MKKTLKKILPTSFLLWFGLFSAFLPFAVFGAQPPECNNFQNPTYTIVPSATNPTGGSDIILNDPIQTRLSLLVKNATTTGSKDDVQIYLVMDVSGSMDAEYGPVGSKITAIQAAKNALNDVVDTIASNGGNPPNPKNLVGLISFAGDARVEQDLISDSVPFGYASVKTAIDSLATRPASTTATTSPQYDAEKGTDMYEGLTTAGNLFASSTLPAQTQRFIVLATDGRQTADPKSQSTADAAIASVPSDVTVYTIGLGKIDYVNQPPGPPPPPGTPPFFLTQVANKDANYAGTRQYAYAGTGEGEYYYSDVTDLTDVFRKIITGILSLKLKIVSIFSFLRDDISHTEIDSTSPAYNWSDTDILSPTYKQLFKWNDLGTLFDGDVKSIDINYKTTVLTTPGPAIPLNQEDLFVEYDISGTPGKHCVDKLTLPVLNVNIQLACVPGPPWIPDQPPGDVCTTQTVTQHKCGNPGPDIPGEKTCMQCSDKIDNDGDGLIDFDGGDGSVFPVTAPDLGCSGPSDNREKSFRFFFHNF